MRHVLTLTRRELSAYFLGPTAFLIILAFQGMAWLNFTELVEGLSRNPRALSGLRDPMNTYLSGSTPFWIGMLIAVPALTMRLFAEERRSGTIETLLTVPVTETEVVVSKWISGVLMYWALLFPYFFYLPFLYHQGEFHFDVGPILALALGMTTIGMMFVSIGLLFSALTRNQIVAAIWTFAVMFMIILLTYFIYTYFLVRNPRVADVVQFLSVLYHVYTFGSGQLDLRFLALHVSVCVLALYLSVKIVEWRRES